MHFFVLVFVYPVIELWLLFKFALAVGFWNAFFITALISALGLGLIFSQSQQILSDFSQGKNINLDYLINYTTKAFSGILIAIPGIISLIFGILLLLPWTQNIFVKFLTNFFHIQPINTYRTSDFNNFKQNVDEINSGRIIEGEIIDDEKK